MDAIKFKLGGARPRAIVLIAMVAGPLLLLSTISYAIERAAARDDADSRARNIATLAQREYQLRAAATHQWVGALAGFDGPARLAEIHADPERCNRTLGGLLASTPGYFNLFVVDTDGKTICSGSPLPTAVNVADRDYFVQTMRTGKPSGGELTIGRVSGRPAVVLSSPILLCDRFV